VLSSSVYSDTLLHFYPDGQREGATRRLYSRLAE